MSDDGWYDEAAGPLVRPYAITGGRTPSTSAQLDVSTQVMSLQGQQEPAGLGPEHVAVVRLCRQPQSIAEVANHLQVPLGVVRVLCSDLIDLGLVLTRSPTHHPVQPDYDTLEAVLHGLIGL